MEMKNELTTLLTVILLFCGVNSVFSQGIKSSIEYSYDDFESSDYETRISYLKEFALNHYLYQKHKHDNGNVISRNERIADGFYFAKSFQLFKEYLQNPEVLEEKFDK